MARHVLSVLAGLVSGGLVIALVQYISHTLYPMPDGLDINNAEQMAQHINSLPLGAFVWVLAAYGLGALVGGMVSAYLSRPQGRVPALLCGIVFTIFGLLNLLFIPHPLWFWVAALSLFVPMAYAGYLIVRRTTLAT